MANSDIENFVSGDFGSSPHIVAPTPSVVRDLKSLLSIARQDRAPLESSNTSNRVHRGSPVLDAASTKGRTEFNGRAAGERYSRISIDNGRPCEESIDVDSRQRRWGMLSAPLDEDDGVFHERSSDSEFDRKTVEAVHDSFRELFAPKQVEGSNFFEGIIDVDREVGFGEDEDFAGQQNGSSNASCDTLVFRPTVSCGEPTTDEGREEEAEVNDLNNIVRGCNGEPDEFVRDTNREIERKESGREMSGRVEDFMRFPFVQEPEIRRGLSNQHSQLFLREGHVNATSKSEKRRLEDDCTVEPVDEQWLLMKSVCREEGVHLEHRQRQWEIESREVQLEKQCSVWNEKPSRLEQERKGGAHAGQNHLLEKKPESMDEVILDRLVEMRQENVVRNSEESLQEEPERSLMPAVGQRHTDNDGNPYSLIIMGFEDRLREADERADRDRKTVEDVVRVREETEDAMRYQHMGWSETQKQLESRINSLEMQHSRLSDTLRETAAALAVEKERRKESRTEADRVWEMLNKERKSHQETLEKLSTCVNSLMKLRGNLAMQKSRSTEDGGPSYLQVVETVLRDMDKELQINLTHLTRKSSDVDRNSSDVDELSRWKQQRDALEAERDKMEESMSSLLRSTRERHGEMEVLWLEREKLLEQKVGCLEVELQHSQMKQTRKDAEILAERQRWEDELEKCRNAWADERISWEATMREREESLSLVWDCLPKTSRDNCSVAKVATEGFRDGSSELSDYTLKQEDKMCNQSRVLQEGASQGINLYNNDAVFDDKISQFCVDVGNLASGMEAGAEKVSKDLRSREGQWEMERMEWKEVEESFKKERQEMEQRVSEAFSLMEELKKEMNGKEAQMEVERKEIQALLMEKATEVERANFLLKSKEHDMEVTVQKFMDEVRLIDNEVEKERKEREQVMELHFASKRKVVMDMKEREEKWEREIESTNQELNNARMEIRQKEKEIEDLKRSSVRAPSERERQLTKAISSLQHEKDGLAAELSKEKGEVRRAIEEMLADVWKVCEEEQIQAAVVKRLGPGEEIRLKWPMLDSLWIEYCRNKGVNGDNKSKEWEDAVGKIPRLNKEISDSMTAIETLRDQLKLKEDELLEARADGERLLKERELATQWQGRVEDLRREKQAMEKSYKVQQDESAEVISNLQGVVRELEWLLKQSKSPHVSQENEGNVIGRGLTQSATKNAKLVKVHASYLEEVDRYILELETKMEVSEKNLRTLEGGLAGRDRKWGGDPVMNSALMKIEKELFSSPDSQRHFHNKNLPDDDGSYYPPQDSRDWDVSGQGLTGLTKRVARKKDPRPVERNMCLTLNGLATLPQDTWADGADEHFALWQLDDRNSLNSITSWMSPRSSTEDMYSAHELPARGLVLPSTSPSTALRRQQKWVVDVRWLEQVRKEHAWLRQQLEIERQRVAALGRVEADNRWIEAAIIRALELKRESDTKVADMTKKVNVMEVLMSKKKPICSTP